MVVRTGTDANIRKRYFPIFHFCFVCVSRSGLRPFSKCYCETFPSPGLSWKFHFPRSSQIAKSPFSSGRREIVFIARGSFAEAESPFRSVRRRIIFIARGFFAVAKSPFTSVHRGIIFILDGYHLSRKVHFLSILTRTSRLPLRHAARTHPRDGCRPPNPRRASWGTGGAPRSKSPSRAGRSNPGTDPGQRAEKGILLTRP